MWGTVPWLSCISQAVSVPSTARSCSQLCPEDGSIGWAGDLSAPGCWSPVPWRNPGLLA